MGHPIFLYRRLADGGLEARIFDSDALPPETEGWSDNPNGTGGVEPPAKKRAKTSKKRKRDQ
jgi:hypothetical protein